MGHLLPLNGGQRLTKPKADPGGLTARMMTRSGMSEQRSTTRRLLGTSREADVWGGEDVAGYVSVAC